MVEHPEEYADTVNNYIETLETKCKEVFLRDQNSGGMENVVSAPFINSFERRLDKFWSSQDVLYDFTKAIRIYHSNNTPINFNLGTGSDEDENDGLPIEFE